MLRLRIFPIAEACYNVCNVTVILLECCNVVAILMERFLFYRFRYVGTYVDCFNYHSKFCFHAISKWQEEKWKKSASKRFNRSRAYVLRNTLFLLYSTNLIKINVFLKLCFLYLRVSEWYERERAIGRRKCNDNN